MAIILNGDTGISSIGALSGVTSVSSASADTPVILQDSSSNSNTCRAWVNFNGTGTVAIRADFNVTSITDRATGQYTVNFTTAMPDANYASVGTHSSVGGDVSTTFIGNASYGGVNSTTASTVNTAVSGGFTDPTYVYVAFFR